MAAIDSEFDFGRGDPLPPPVNKDPFRSFCRDANAQLLDYLQSRNLTSGFLQEIDAFLISHPEISRCSPEWTAAINNWDVFDAYQLFVQGFTRPARYLPGALAIPKDIILPTSIPKMAEKYDPELAAFFGQSPYRHDLLDKMDQEVALIVEQIYHGRRPSYKKRKLLVFCLCGNLVDAYKFYEYSYQESWLPHRYLPEHVILLDVPKPKDYCQPVPSPSRKLDGTYESRRSYRDIRRKMAAAYDAGIDALDVLLDCVTTKLLQSPLKRGDIEAKRKTAMELLMKECSYGEGKDIVDLVMDNIHIPHRQYNPREAEKRKQLMQDYERLSKNLRHAATYHTSFGAGVPDLSSHAMSSTSTQLQRKWVQETAAMAQRYGKISKRAAQHYMSLFTSKAMTTPQYDQQRYDVMQALNRYLLEDK